MQHVLKFPSPAISVVGNLFLAWLFLRAIIAPEQYANFILKIGIMIYVIEFLSVHSGIMLSEREHLGWRAIPRSFMLIALYSVFALGAGFMAKNWLVPIIFFVSLIAKVAGLKPADGKLWISGLLLIGSMGLAMFPAQLLQSHSPLPTGIYEAILERSSGLETRPLIFMFWGVLYYVLSAMLEVFFFFREKDLITPPQK
ncbi:hypothetical protein HYX14_02670 [Candidatus Woesearchaeota archaeon]|nr:hypothetical protein [Candidatus Woesearchaeota archaeon]